MKILLIANSSFALYKFRSELIVYFVKRGVDVLCMIPDNEYEDELRSLGVEVGYFILERHSRSLLSALRSLHSIYCGFRQHRPDYVLSFTIKPNVFSGLLSLVQQYKLVSNVTGLGRIKLKNTFSDTFVLWVYKLTLQTAKTVFVQNAEDENSMKNGMFNLKSIVRLPGSGIKITPFHKSYSEKGKLNLLFASRLITSKGINLILDAVPLLSSYSDYFHVHIAGKYEHGDPDSVNFVKLQQVVSNCENMTYHGFLEDISPLLDQCDAVILPSVYPEGTPRILLEALNKGKIIITTDTAGCRDALYNETNGFLIEPTVSALQNCILELLNSTSEELDKMKLCSRSLAIKRFSVDKVISEYEKAIFTDGN